MGLFISSYVDRMKSTLTGDMRSVISYESPKTMILTSAILKENLKKKEEKLVMTVVTIVL